MSVDFSEADYKAIQKAFNKLKNKKMQPFFSDVGRRLVADFAMGFRMGKAPDDKPWAPLKHRQGQPLRDTGRLQRSITFKATETELEIGTNVIYSTTHQFGMDKQNVPEHTKIINQVFGKPIEPKTIKVKAHTKNPQIPARPFIGIETRQKKKIAAAFQAAINEALGNKAQAE